MFPRTAYNPRSQESGANIPCAAYSPKNSQGGCVPTPWAEIWSLHPLYRVRGTPQGVAPVRYEMMCTDARAMYTNRGSCQKQTSRGDAAAPTWIFRGDNAHACHVEISRNRERPEPESVTPL